jgi:hypothetical protein
MREEAMSQKASAGADWKLRWAYELFLSLNVAWMIVWFEIQGGRHLGRFFFLPWERKLYFSFRSLHPEAVVFQTLWSVILASLLFLLVHILTRFSRTDAFLRVLAGASGIAGFPVLALHSPRLFSIPYEIMVGDYWQWFYPVESYRPWLIIEVLAASIWATLYYVRQWPVSRVLTSFSLISHFGLWSWAGGMHVNVLDLAHAYGSLRTAFWMSAIYFWGFPILGFLASLTWCLYLRTPVSGRPRSEC